MVFEKLSFWMKGRFVCRKCGREFHAFSFGFGEAICPDCYEGEPEFLFLDTRYWLNRIMIHLTGQEIPKIKPIKEGVPLENQVHMQPELEILE
ncbi:MAG: hypothetical protein O2V44_10045 [Candidatus Bathyarchaeota archaeon]|nr:hypothetical protein [Candidatus Bathyarchaeota archaeon]